MNRTYNSILAAAVAVLLGALFERGVEASQISSVGRGETTPVAGNDSPTGRQHNRRVELVFQDDRSRVASDSD